MQDIAIDSLRVERASRVTTRRATSSGPNLRLSHLEESTGVSGMTAPEAGWPGFTAGGAGWRAGGDPAPRRGGFASGSGGRREAAGILAELRLQGLKRCVQVPDGVVAALGIAGVRQRVRREPTQASLVDHDADVVDEISCWGPAVAVGPGQVA